MKSKKYKLSNYINFATLQFWAHKKFTKSTQKKHGTIIQHLQGMNSWSDALYVYSTGLAAAGTETQ